MAGCRDFAGADYIDFGTASIFSGQSACTMMFWVNLDTINNNDYFAAKWTSTQKPLFMGVNGTGKLEVSIGKGDDGTQTVEATTANLSTLMSTGTWTHICGVNDLPDSSSAAIYIDGVLQTSSKIFDTATAATIATNTAPYFLGALSTPAHYMDGRLAQVGVYSGILSQDQINELMYNPFAFVPISQIPVYGADSPEIDLGTGNSGTVTNTTAVFDGPPIYLLGGQ